MRLDVLRNAPLGFVLTAVALVVPPSWAQAPSPLPTQTPAMPPRSGDSDNGPVVRDSSVGYIDGAIPGTQLRLRYDAAWNNRRPNRAEFFYARGAPMGPGLLEPEKSVDYQDLFAYLEAAVNPRLSAFVELPVRFLIPEVNENSAGYADMNFGFKYAFIFDPDLVTTFQFRTYLPTGDADRGLGTNHVSLEPALLLYLPLSDRLAVEGEFRCWVPIGGTDFAGNILRYGAGLRYDLFETCQFKISPVAEFVGWTVLDGKATVVGPALPLKAEIENASGDTIVNVKLGTRVRFSEFGDVYVGYGRPLTRDRWYENVLRLELRLAF